MKTLTALLKGVRQVPFPYVLLLSAMTLLLGYVLLKIDIPVTWQLIAGAIMPTIK